MLKRLLPDISLRDWFTLDWRKVDPIRTVLLILLILAVAAALWQYFCPQIRTVTQWQFHPVPVIKETVKIKKVLVPCPEQGLVVLDKQQVAEKLDLPWLQGGDIASAKVSEEVTSPSPEGTAPVAGNPANLQVTATAQLPESDNGYQVVTVVNTATGVTTPVVKEQEAPWLQFRNDGAIGANYDINQRLQNQWDIYLRWDFLRLKGVYINTHGRLDNDGDARIGFGGEYRWHK